MIFMGVGSIARIARTIRKYSWLSAQSMWTLCNTILQTCLWWLNLFDDHISPKYDRYLLFSLIMWLSFSCKCLALNHDHYHDDLYEAKAWLTEQPVWGRSRSAGPPVPTPMHYRARAIKEGPFRFATLASHFIRIQIFQIDLPPILSASKYFR